ncbi:MAG TPA: GNAT family N-acetyltransferase [Sphingomicrobium sp.]|nr:GNAT family N-acetyltransferase [Sphingomicrobium sp.]
MSDLDELSESARNRGLKLVRSRVRTPGKRRFGKVGLADARGKPVFGLDAKGPTAKPEEVQDYLRNLGAKDWGASLDVAVLPRKRKPAKAPRESANDAEPKPKPPAEPKPKPTPPPTKPKLRDVRPADAKQLVELIHDLGHEIDEKAIRKNLAALRKSGETPLVATLGKRVIGLVGMNKRIAVHKPAPIGRISVLVVADDAQDKGIGRMLVEAAEAWFRKQGCTLVEVTSNDRRTAAHAFYRHMGYERTSIRFAKDLQPL